MEDIEEKTLAFLDVGFVYGYGFGSGIGSGSGSGDGLGDGYGYGDGDGDGLGDGLGDGYGYGDGDGDGDGDGLGDGLGSGDGFGDGYGDGDGAGDGVGCVDGKRVYRIDGTPTIITALRGDVAEGSILSPDLTLTPCYVVRGNGKFAHGRTLHEAFSSLQEKLYDGSTEEERLEAFKAKFPEYDTPYSNADLYAYHHVLTGSCRMGRDNFRERHGLTLDGTMTVREFVGLTKGAYGGAVISKLPGMYDAKNDN